MTVSAQKKWLISLILDMSDEQVAELNEYAIRNHVDTRGDVYKH